LLIVVEDLLAKLFQGELVVVISVGTVVAATKVLMSALHILARPLCLVEEVRYDWVLG
jgi:hypothetical protein